MQYNARQTEHISKTRKVFEFCKQDNVLTTSSKLKFYSLPKRYNKIQRFEQKN